MALKTKGEMILNVGPTDVYAMTWGVSPQSMESFSSQSWTTVICGMEGEQ